MIPLIFQNANVFVWNCEDWKKLRQEYRIVGNLFGGLARAPFQNNFSGLPCVLLEEEVTLLLEKGICTLVTYKSLHPSSDVESKWEKYKSTSKAEQQQHVVTERKRNITSMIDRIIEGKKKKLSLKKSNALPNEGEANTDIELDKENVLRAELERVDQTPLTHNLVLTFSEDPWLTENDVIEIKDWNFPHTEKESLRYKVFKDLWGKGYYITCGQKFGGDFLIYPGDPVLYHAHYIILCKDNNEPIPFLEITSHCRVGSSSRKTLVLASVVDQNTLSYTSVQFQSFSRCLI